MQPGLTIFDCDGVLVDSEVDRLPGLRPLPGGAWHQHRRRKKSRTAISA